MKDVSSLDVEMGGEDCQRPSRAWEAFMGKLIRLALNDCSIPNRRTYGFISRPQSGKNRRPAPGKESP